MYNRDSSRAKRAPYAVRVLPLVALAYAAFIAWWWAMAVAFGEGYNLAGLAIGYSLPAGVSLLSYLSSRSSRSHPEWNLAPLLSLPGFAVLYFSLILLLGNPGEVTWIVTRLDAQGGLSTQLVTVSIFSDVSPFIGIGLISSVISIMLYPAAGSAEYFRYRPVLFVAGVIFMPLFVVISVILRSPASLPDKAWLLAAAMAGFWASAAWLAARRTQGTHVSGLEIGPGLPFRPDLILPGGVTYVKGVIMTGVGMMIMFQESFTLPRWNWWGFVLAFWGIITIIPLRGIYKMFFGRRRRFLGDPRGATLSHGFIKGNILFVGLLLLLYGFLSAFMGVVPFVSLWPRTELLPYAIALILTSHLILAFLREPYKRRLSEGIESTWELTAKLLILYAGTLVLLYGFITLFMGRWMTVHLEGNPAGFALGLGLLLSGMVLIIPVRYRALQNEFAATIRIMAGVIADLPEEEKRSRMGERMSTLVGMKDAQRTSQIGLMLQGLQELPEEKRLLMRRTMMELMADMPSPRRLSLMKSMDDAQLAS